MPDQFMDEGWQILSCPLCNSRKIIRSKEFLEKHFDQEHTVSSKRGDQYRKYLKKQILELIKLSYTRKLDVQYRLKCMYKAYYLTQYFEFFSSINLNQIHADIITAKAELKANNFRFWESIELYYNAYKIYVDNHKIGQAGFCLKNVIYKLLWVIEKQINSLRIHKDTHQFTRSKKQIKGLFDKIHQHLLELKSFSKFNLNEIESIVNYKQTIFYREIGELDKASQFLQNYFELTSKKNEYYFYQARILHHEVLYRISKQKYLSTKKYDKIIELLTEAYLEIKKFDEIKALTFLIDAKKFEAIANPSKFYEKLLEGWLVAKESKNKKSEKYLSEYIINHNPTRAQLTEKINVLKEISNINYKNGDSKIGNEFRIHEYMNVGFLHFNEKNWDKAISSFNYVSGISKKHKIIWDSKWKEFEEKILLSSFYKNISNSSYDLAIDYISQIISKFKDDKYRGKGSFPLRKLQYEIVNALKSNNRDELISYKYNIESLNKSYYDFEMKILFNLALEFITAKIENRVDFNKYQENLLVSLIGYDEVLSTQIDTDVDELYIETEWWRQFPNDFIHSMKKFTYTWDMTFNSEFFGEGAFISLYKVIEKGLEIIIELKFKEKYFNNWNNRIAEIIGSNKGLGKCTLGELTIIFKTIMFDSKKQTSFLETIVANLENDVLVTRNQTVHTFTPSNWIDHKKDCFKTLYLISKLFPPIGEIITPITVDDDTAKFNIKLISPQTSFHEVSICMDLKPDEINKPSINKLYQLSFPLSYNMNYTGIPITPQSMISAETYSRLIMWEPDDVILISNLSNFQRKKYIIDLILENENIVNKTMLIDNFPEIEKLINRAYNIISFLFEFFHFSFGLTGEKSSIQNNKIFSNPLIIFIKILAIADEFYPNTGKSQMLKTFNESLSGFFSNIFIGRGIGQYFELKYTKDELSFILSEFRDNFSEYNFDVPEENNILNSVMKKALKSSKFEIIISLFNIQRNNLNSILKEYSSFFSKDHHKYSLISEFLSQLILNNDLEGIKLVIKDYRNVLVIEGSVNLLINNFYFYFIHHYWKYYIDPNYSNVATTEYQKRHFDPIKVNIVSSKLNYLLNYFKFQLNKFERIGEIASLFVSILKINPKYKFSKTK